MNKIIARVHLSFVSRLYKVFGFRHYLILLHPSKTINFGTINPNLTFEVATLDFLKEKCNSEQYQLSSEFIETALTKNHVCVVGLFDQEVVAYAWFAETESLVDRDVWLRFSSSYCYVYKCFVKNEFRGRNILPQMLHSSTKMEVNGNKPIFSFIVPINKSSVRSFKKTGFKITGSLTLFNTRLKLLYLISSSLSSLELDLYRPFEDRHQ